MAPSVSSLKSILYEKDNNMKHLDSLELSRYTIIEDINLTEPKEVERSFKERIFSLPWKPWRATKYIQVPKQEAYTYYDVSTGGRLVVMHPSLVDKLRKELKEQEQR